MTRKNKSLSAIPLNFLLGCSERSLGSYELTRLAAVANLRGELHQILDKLIDEMAQAALAAWFRMTDRASLKQALENPEDVIAWVQRRIRDQQRSEDELVPRPSLAPGAAHLAAALHYAERNIAAGKCRVCPQPLARNSAELCEKHLAMSRAKYKPKGGRASRQGQLTGYTVTVFSKVELAVILQLSLRSQKHGRSRRKRRNRTAKDLQCLASPRKRLWVRKGLSQWDTTPLSGSSMETIEV